MDKKGRILVICATILVLSFVGTASATNWSVDGSGGADFTGIQDAINNAKEGDTILVYSGTYAESISVDKSLIIKSEKGAKETIVQISNWRNGFTVRGDDYVTINGFTINGSRGNYGIFLEDSNHSKLMNNVITNNYRGIYLYRSNRTTLINNTVSDKNDYSIWLEKSNYNMISDNNVSNNYDGIRLVDSNSNELISNFISANYRGRGIFLTVSYNNILIDNVVSHNHDIGIYLRFSGNNTLESNIMKGNGYNFGVYGFNRLSCYVQNIDTSNKVDGKPIYYWINQKNKRIPTDAGYIGLVNCTNITIKDLTMKDKYQGLLLANTSNSRVENFTALNNVRGIELACSTNNSLKNNTLLENRFSLGVYGTALAHYIQDIDTSNKINGKPVYYWINEKNNQIPSDAGFVGIVNSTNITVKNLSLTNNTEGVLLAYTSNSKIENLTLSNNDDGIYLDNSTNNVVTNNNVSNNLYGIRLDDSITNKVTDNEISSNFHHGIFLVLSDDNIMVNNSVSYNYHCIWSYMSNNNSFYLNNFLNNTNEPWSDANKIHSLLSTNTYNSSEPIIYTYNGNTYTNYLGNHWGDYGGSDAAGDGIGDTRYSISDFSMFDVNEDIYPLMEPSENYIITAPTLP